MASLTRQQRRAKARAIAKGNREAMGEEIMLQAHKFMTVSAVVAANYAEDLAKLPYGERLTEYMDIYCNELDRMAEYCRNGGSCADWANEETNGWYYEAYVKARSNKEHVTTVDPEHLEKHLGDR